MNLVLVLLCLLISPQVLAQLDVGGGGISYFGATSIAPPTPCVNGSAYYDTVVDDLYICKSTAWVATGSGAVGTSPLELTEQGAPSLSAAGEVICYADTDHTLKCSQNGGPFEVLGESGGGPFTASKLTAASDGTAADPALELCSPSESTGLFCDAAGTGLNVTVGGAAVAHFNNPAQVTGGLAVVSDSAGSGVCIVQTAGDCQAAATYKRGMHLDLGTIRMYSSNGVVGPLNVTATGFQVSGTLQGFGSATVGGATANDDTLVMSVADVGGASFPSTLTMVDQSQSNTFSLPNGTGNILIDTLPVSSTGQVSSTLDPSDIAFSHGSIIANPAACDADEILLGAGAGNARKASFDCEGDVVAVRGDYSGVLTSTSQVTSTLNPVNTTFANGSVIANPAACGTDEILVGAGVNGTRKASFDCEGDVVGVKGTYSAVLTSSSQVTSTLDPADTTFANGSIISNPASCGSNEILMGVGVAGTSKATLDCEGDIVGVKGNYSGVLTSSSQVTTTLNPADTTFANGSLLANPAACGSNEILLGAGVAGTAKMTADCEGDVVAVRGDYSGVLTSSSQVTSTLNPADTTFANGSMIANPAACGTNEILMGAGVAGTAKATFDCEGDIVGVKGDFSGAVTTTSTLTNNGGITVSRTAVSGIETLVTFNTTDDTTSCAAIVNSSGTDAQWVPTWHGFTSVAGNEPRITVGITAANDSGTAPALLIQGYRATACNASSGALVTRPLIAFYNYTTELFDINADGSLSNPTASTPTGGTAGDFWIKDGTTISGSLNVRPTATSGSGATSWLSVVPPSSITQAGLLHGINLDMATNFTVANQTTLGYVFTPKAATYTSGTLSEAGYYYAGAAVTDNGATLGVYGALISMGAITGTSGTVISDGVNVTIPASAAIVTAGTMNGLRVVAPTTSGPAAGTLNGVNIAALTSAGAATENALLIGTGWDTAIDVSSSAFKVSGTGAITTTSTATKNTCTLVSGTPSTCTATVTSGCLPVCGYGALGVGSIAPSTPVYCTVSGTTLTATGGNTSVNTVNILCM